MKDYEIKVKKSNFIIDIMKNKRRREVIILLRNYRKVSYELKKIIGLLVLFLSISLIDLSISYAESDESNQESLKSPPRVTYQVPVNCPPEEALYNLSGNVSVEIEVSKSGLITKVSIHQSSGYELLDNAVLEAVKQWRFLPAQDKNGQAIDLSILMRFGFKLSDYTPAYTAVKSVIDSWDPRNLDTYIHPGVYNSNIIQIYTQVNQFDFNNKNDSLEKLVFTIRAVDINKKYNIKVYNALARKIIKKVYPKKDQSALWDQKAKDSYLKSNYKEAIFYYNKAITLEPYDAEYYQERAFDHFLLDDNLSAVNDYNKAIELEPNNDHNYMQRGTSFFLLKDYQNALADYCKAIELKPDVADNYYERGTVYYELKEYQNAIRDYEKAIEYHDDYRFYASRGESYRALQKYREAIDDYNKSIELASYKDVAYCYYDRGMTYLVMQDYIKALSDFNKAIEISPNSVVFYSGRAQTYYELMDYQKAINDYSQAIAKLTKDPKSNSLRAEFYINRASAYQKLGKFKEADDDTLVAKKLETSKS